MKRHRVIRSSVVSLVSASLRRTALLFAAVAASLVVAGSATAQQITIPPAALEAPAALPLVAPAVVAPTPAPVVTAPLAAPAAPTSALTAPLADDVFARGQKLEEQHRWGEALALYEEVSRKDPPTPGIDDRIEIARIHYDLGRRCADSSFRRGLAQIDEPRALQLFDEVLTKIDSHYVQEPNWNRLVARGTLDLEVAINEPAFVANNRLQSTPAEINEFRRQLHGLTDNRPVRNRNEARDLVTAAAQLAQTSPSASAQRSRCWNT